MDPQILLRRRKFSVHGSALAFTPSALARLFRWVINGLAIAAVRSALHSF
jgi:hypothetical protein